MVLNFFFTMYTAQYLGAKGFGVLSFAFAFTGMFSIFTDAGLAQLTVREVARDKSLAERYIGNTLSIKLVLSVITISITYITVSILNYPSKTILVVVLISLSVIINAFSKVFFSIFQAFEKVEFQSIGQILNSILMFVGALIAIKYNYDIIAFSYLYVIMNFINLTYIVAITAFKFTKPVLKAEFVLWKELFIKALPFAITGISINIYSWIDTVMLSLLKGDEVVGWYNAAYRLIFVLLFIPVVFNNAVYPLMSQYYVSSKETLIISFEKLFKSMIYIGLPIGTGTMFVADKVTILIFGDQFINSIIALQILIWSLVLIFSRSSFERLLESTNQQASVTKIFVFGAGFNIIINLILIPKFSYIGAGIATVLTDIIVLTFLIIATRNFKVVSKDCVNFVIKVILSCLIMGLFLVYSRNLNLLVTIIISTIIYIVSSLKLRVFDESDILLLRSIYSKKTKIEYKSAEVQK